jgi:hypothetical protein
LNSTRARVRLRSLVGTSSATFRATLFLFVAPTRFRFIGTAIAKEAAFNGDINVLREPVDSLEEF